MINKLNMMNIMNKTKELKKRVTVVLTASMVLLQGVPASAAELDLSDESVGTVLTDSLLEDGAEYLSAEMLPADILLEDADENIPRDGVGEDIPYIYYTYKNSIPANGIDKILTGKCSSYTAIGTTTTAWGADSSESWYVASGDVTIDPNTRVTVTGDVHLILTDGCKLTIKKGISVEDDNSLTIYGQENCTGKLCVEPETTDYSNAGIGGKRGASTGSSGGNSGKITINGGQITVKVSTKKTALGGGAGNYGGNGGNGNIIINGGTVTA
ncbi:MAG: hypothetical protein IKS84_06205, partial [Lachnospiraceae bacterium]|nr:hypothetical protein [Lachnospiraceae bacterium]